MLIKEIRVVVFFFLFLNLGGSFCRGVIDVGVQCIPETVRVDNKAPPQTVSVVSAEGAQTRADNQVLTVCVMVN